MRQLKSYCLVVSSNMDKMTSKGCMSKMTSFITFEVNMAPYRFGQFQSVSSVKVAFSTHICCYRFVLSKSSWRPTFVCHQFMIIAHCCPFMHFLCLPLLQRYFSLILSQYSFLPKFPCCLFFFDNSGLVASQRVRPSVHPSYYDYRLFLFARNPQILQALWKISA